MKKIGLLSLSLLVILFIGTTYANPIALNTHCICSKLKNVEIDNYRVVIENKNGFYEPKKNECIKCNGDNDWSSSKAFLVDKSIKITSINNENIENISIPLGIIYTTTLKEDYDEIIKYNIINNGDNYELVRIENTNNILNFPYVRLIAIITETIILFVLAKLFRKQDQISNWKLILFGALPTTITLPFLQFVLPLIIEKGLWYTIIGELLVTIIEAIILKYGLKISRWKAIMASVICNATSYSVGLLIL